MNTTKFVAQTAHDAFNTDLDYALVNGILVHMYNIKLQRVELEIARACEIVKEKENKTT